MQKTIEQRIRSGYGDMRKSEQRAADYILDHLNHVRELSLDRLANEAEVSQPTVIRMLKALGFKRIPGVPRPVVKRVCQG